MASRQEHRIEIEAAGRNDLRVHYGDKVLIERTRDPEFAACRALLALGKRGTLVTRWRGSRIDAMRVYIEQGAEFTVRGGKIRRWRAKAVPEGAGPADNSTGRAPRSASKSPPSATGHRLAAI